MIRENNKLFGTTLQDKLLIIASALGNILEYFDFMIFIFLTPIISKLFFPQEVHHLAVLFTYLIISISYIFRPIGGVVMGYLGDKYGRKIVFCVSLCLMGFPSLIISCLPTFSQIGYKATIIMIASRILQGIALGGEVPCSITYISEKFKGLNYFFYLSWLTFGSNIGVALGTQTLNLLNLMFTKSFIYAFAWRIPFIIGGVLATLGFLIRSRFTESKEFIKIWKMRQLCRIPILKLWNDYKPQMLSGVILCSLVSFTTAVFIVFLPNLLSVSLSMDFHSGSNLSAIGSLIVAFCSVLLAYITKYINPILIVKISMLGLTISLFIILFNHYKYNPYYIVCTLSFFISGINGTFFGILSDLFPTAVRFSGIALCYNVAYLINAGLTPLWVGYLILLADSAKNILMISLILLLVIVISFRPNVDFYKGA